MASPVENSRYLSDQPALTLEEKLGSVFQPDTLASEQYFQNLRRRTLLEPEKRLMLAVLEDAVHRFQDNMPARDRKKRRLCEEAEEWIVDEDADWLFSFASICEVLGLDPRYVRRGLLRWKEQRASRRSHAAPWKERAAVG